MKLIIIKLMTLLWVFSNNPSSGLHKYQNIDSLNFEKRIEIIHSKIGDLTDIFVLHHVKEFNDVYLTPIRFEEPVINFISKPVNFESKIIAVCSMTRLPFKNYIEILNIYFNLYKNNKIDEQLLNRCIFNEFDTDNRLIKQYKNPQVRKLLNELVNYKTLSKQFRKDLKETLSGNRYNTLKRTGHLQ